MFRYLLKAMNCDCLASSNPGPFLSKAFIAVCKSVLENTRRKALNMQNNFRKKNIIKYEIAFTYFLLQWRFNSFKTTKKKNNQKNRKTQKHPHPLKKDTHHKTPTYILSQKSINHAVIPLLKSQRWVIRKERNYFSVLNSCIEGLSCKIKFWYSTLKR